MPKLKVACLQLSPVHGDPAGNMKTADDLLASLSREDGLHVLLLPEMAFSGYCFDDVAAVRGVLENDRGATVEWCKRHAVRLQCTVLCGYPRSVILDHDDDEAAENPNKMKKQKNNDAEDDDERGRGEDARAGGDKRGGGSQGDDPQMTSAPAGINTTTTNDTPGVVKEEEEEEVKEKQQQKQKIKNEKANENVTEQLYNALVVVGPDGTVLAHYHKFFLYCIDKTWASEGGGFMSVPIPFVTRGNGGDAGGERVEESVLASLGICMDINPREFEAPWRAYELASACKAHGSSVLLFSSAWTDSHPDDDPKSVPPVNRDEILTYWLSRLEPLVGSDVHFVCANRVGMENGITFTGCSCVMSLKEPRVVAALGPKDVGVMVQELEVPTAAQLAVKQGKKQLAEEERKTQLAEAAVTRGEEAGGEVGGDER